MVNTNEILRQHNHAMKALFVSSLVEEYKKMLTKPEGTKEELEQRIVAFHTLFKSYLTYAEQLALDNWRWKQIEIIVAKIPKVD